MKQSIFALGDDGVHVSKILLIYIILTAQTESYKHSLVSSISHIYK
jgi:hypothetical protein